MLMDADGMHLRTAAGPRLANGWIEAITPLEIGTGNPGSFIKKNRDDLLIDVRLSVTAHLELCHHFAPILVKRGHGGILFVWGMGARHGGSHIANSGGAKADVLAFSQSLPFQFKEQGGHVAG